MGDFEVGGWVETIKTTALLRTARILKKKWRFNQLTHKWTETTLPYRRNQGEKNVNELLKDIATDNMTESIYAGGKILGNKIGIPQWNQNRSTKIEKEILLGQIKYLRQVKITKEDKADMNPTKWNYPEKTTENKFDKISKRNKSKDICYRKET